MIICYAAPTVTIARKMVRIFLNYLVTLLQIIIFINKLMKQSDKDSETGEWKKDKTHIHTHKHSTGVCCSFFRYVLAQNIGWNRALEWLQANQIG